MKYEENIKNLKENSKIDDKDELFLTILDDLAHNLRKMVRSI